MKHIVILIGQPQKKRKHEPLVPPISARSRRGRPQRTLYPPGGKTHRLLPGLRRLYAQRRSLHPEDDMEGILCAFQQADVVVLATPVYFYGVSAQMKACIDRTYPIWQHLGRKEVYYIVSAGLGEDIIARSLGDLDGFVEHFEQYEIKGRLYAPNVMEAGAVRTQPVMEAAYQAGLHV